MATATEQAIEKWHQYITGKTSGDRQAWLDELIAEDCVFISPVVFTPQKGKAVTIAYLQAAGVSFSPDGKGGGKPKDESEKFRYIKQVVAGNVAILEFETTLGGKYINGVDIITCNEAGQITEFKVMVRPLQAVNMIHERMGAALAKAG